MARKLYAIIGDPIDQARSPEVFNRLFAERDVDAEMIALHVRAAQLRSALDGLAVIDNFAGAVITIPHKPAAAALAASRSERVRIAGVANALKPGANGWSAELFDGLGFVAGLARGGHSAEVQSAAVVGAGGAGLAIAAALLDAGTARVAIDDVDATRAAAAHRALSATYPGRVERRRPGSADAIVINATPVGMRSDDPLPFALEGLDDRALVADAIMKPPRTRLLDEAARRGHPTHEGRHMLDAQADALWRFLDMGPAR
jgi:shikimate dehydrogenase